MRFNTADVLVQGGILGLVHVEDFVQFGHRENFQDSIGADYHAQAFAFRSNGPIEADQRPKHGRIQVRHVAEIHQGCVRIREGAQLLDDSIAIA